MKLVDQYYNPVRGSSQPEVDRAYVLLERNGFKVDIPYFNRQAELANSDLLDALEKGGEIYRNTVPVGPEKLSGDSLLKLWSSPSQLDFLIHDYLKIAPSPIWLKGEVNFKKGERKTDATALRYLAAVNSQYKPLIDSILLIRKIRSCLKYLTKLPTFVDPTDGLIHPVYGAESDSSESTGSNSGRSVMKSPEGQQITNSKDKDPYGIRRGFIAPDGYVLTVRDYAAMEAVLLHCICLALFGDDSLSATNDPSIDFHGENARMVFGTVLKWTHPTSGRLLDTYSLDDFQHEPYLKDRRRDAKTVFYGLQFCKSPRGFAFTILGKDGKPVGLQIATEIVEGFLQVRTAIRKFQNWVQNYLLALSERGMSGVWLPGIGSFSGRWRNCLDLVDNALITGQVDSQFRKAWRQCCNHPEQAGGADIKTTALVHLHKMLAKEIGPTALAQNDIHDELIVRHLPQDEKAVGEIMKICMEDTYPLPCDQKLRTNGSTGLNWMDAK